MPLVTTRPPKWVEMSYIRWLWSDLETMLPVGGPVLLTDEQAEGWFRRMVVPGNPLDHYRLILAEDDRPVGEASWHRLDPYTMTAQLNIKVAHSERMRGYGHDALEQLLRHFFCRRGGKLMIDDVAPDNHGGQQMLRQFGFKADPGATNVYRMSMARQRFIELYSCEEPLLVPADAETETADPTPRDDDSPPNAEDSSPRSVRLWDDPHYDEDLDDK